MKKTLIPFLLITALVACTTPEPEDVTPGTSTGNGNPSARDFSATITTIAGTDTQKGFVDGKGTAAKFNYPAQMTVDKNDNLYVIDQRRSYYGGSVIRKVDPAGNVSTFAKGLGSVTDICVDPRDGVTLYAIECGDAVGVTNGIFRISSTGEVTRLSGGPDPDGGYSFGYRDGPLARAKFSNPWSIIMDKAGILYIGDNLNHCIRRVDLAAGMVTTLAGKPTESTVCQYADGKGSEARLCTVEDLTLDESGNLYVPDWGNHSVRKITPDGTVSTFLKLSTGYTPDSPRSKNGVYQPYRIQYDAVNRQLFVVVDTGGGLKMVTADDYVYGLGGHVISTDYADRSPGSQHGIYSMAVTKKGDLYLLDQYNHCIRKVTITWK